MKKWVQEVTTESTFPPPGTFSSKNDGMTIAKIMAKKEVSPLGLGSAIKMVVYFKNRGGKRLTEQHKKNLDDAIKILQQWNQQ